MLRFYREQDADPAALATGQVAVIGYGGLGRPMALNLRDSGLAVTVGNIADTYRQTARRDGFDPAPISAAAAAADLVFVLLPDAVIPGCFAAEIAPALRPGTAVCFASGYALAYGLVRVPDGNDVLLFAPRMPGTSVRSTYLDGTGYVSCLSVEADATGRARDRLLALALAGGGLRRGAYQLNAVNEAALDLLVEQTLGVYLGLCIQSVFRLGTDAGLPAEALVLELYMSGEMSRTFDGFAREGFYSSLGGHSLTALYGGFVRTQDADGAEMERMVSAALKDITSGGFARRFQEELAAGAPLLEVIRGFVAEPSPMSEAESRVRAVLGNGNGGP
jgi:ketol-acid reductoisomerase